MNNSGELIKLGWSKNAIYALLGNLQTESTINPGKWQGKEGNMNLGFGLCQWSSARDYFLWAEENNLDPYSIDTQIIRLQLEVEGEIYQWQSFRNEANISFKDFTQSEMDPKKLAEIYMDCYERPKSNVSREDRRKQADDWYKFFNNISE